MPSWEGGNHPIYFKTGRQIICLAVTLYGFVRTNWVQAGSYMIRLVSSGVYALRERPTDETRLSLQVTAPMPVKMSSAAFSGRLDLFWSDLVHSPADTESMHNCRQQNHQRHQRP